MAHIDGSDDAVRGGLGAAQARAVLMHERRKYELKVAVFGACHALRETGLTEGRIVRMASEKGVPFTRSVVAKLTSDGDDHGWRAPSLRTCQVLDAICRDRNIVADLTGLRKALDQAAQALRAAEAVDRAADNSRNLSYALRAALEGELRDYLTALGRVLARTSAWLPYRRLDAGFAERLVKVTDEAPVAAPDGGLYREPPQGTVRWECAIEGVPIAVVLADAGYGKTWQLRRHCLRLCEQALAALDSDISISEVPLPLWVPAGDLARCWPGHGSPAVSIVTAATSELRRSGMPVSAELADFLAGRLTVGSVHVLIDAYDEVFDDGLRSSVKQALNWLTEGVHRDAVRIVLASRQAGYDQPFDLRGEPDDEDAGSAAVGRLAVGLAWAAPDDPEVFDVLVGCAGRHPHPLTDAALYVYDLPLPMKCDALGRTLLYLPASRPRAVEIWSRALRDLLQQAPQHERQRFRGLCAAATQHLLRLPKEA
jgi:hypothetical protein